MTRPTPVRSTPDRPATPLWARLVAWAVAAPAIAVVVGCLTAVAVRVWEWAL